MNGHTSNYTIANALASQYMRSFYSVASVPQEDRELTKAYIGYHEGIMDAMEQTAIILFVNKYFDEMVAVRKARKIEEEKGGAPAGT